MPLVGFVKVIASVGFVTYIMYQKEALVWVLFQVLGEKVRGVEGHAEQYRQYPLCSAHSHGVCLILLSSDQQRRGAQSLHLSAFNMFHRVRTDVSYGCTPGHSTVSEDRLRDTGD